MYIHSTKSMFRYADNVHTQASTVTVLLFLASSRARKSVSAFMVDFVTLKLGAIFDRPTLLEKIVTTVMRLIHLLVTALAGM